jgi:hypothetical protein
MTQLTEAEKIARYDAERSGEIYTKPQPPEIPAGERSPLFYDLKAWIESHFEAEQADQIAIARACDQAIAEHRAARPAQLQVERHETNEAAHREERFLAIMETIAAMDEPEKSEALGYARGVLDGMLLKQEPAAPAVRSERRIADEGYAGEEFDGREYATSFFCGEVEIFCPDAGVPLEAPQLIAFGRDGLDISEVLEALPSIQALISDPRVQAAIDAWKKVGLVRV